MTKYEMPSIRSQILEVVRDAYPATFEGLGPSKPLGEDVFSGPTPHPNEVLNLFIQQKLTFALPMAYYMVTRRGLNSLMDRFPSSMRTVEASFNALAPVPVVAVWNDGNLGMRS